MIVELAGLEFIDVNGVRALAELVDQGERCLGRAGVEVHGASGQPLELIQLLGYESLAPVAVRVKSGA